jgi:hypothetical protein
MSSRQQYDSNATAGDSAQYLAAAVAVATGHLLRDQQQQL